MFKLFRLRIIDDYYQMDLLVSKRGSKFIASQTKKNLGPARREVVKNLRTPEREEEENLSLSTLIEQKSSD